MSVGKGSDRVPAAVRLAELEEIEVTVDKLVAGGDGLARFEGIPLFVPRSAPGDRLRVRLIERHPDYGRAEIVEILEPGPGRRTPPCPYFERCGGCDLQHLGDDLQTRLKAEAAVETLARLGGIEAPEDLEVIAGDPWAYRLRAQLHVEEGEEGHVRVGYHQRRSHELVAVTECPILVPELETMLPGLPAALAGETLRRLDLAAGGPEERRVTTAPLVEGLPHGNVSLTVGGLAYTYDARAFFQAHRGLLERLLDEAVGQWTGRRACDLYAGVGLFALPLAQRYEEVVAVEADRAAARHCRNNARRNRLRNVETVGRVVESWIGELPDGMERVVVDPPRAGLHRKVRRALLERAPERLTYVSCHPATLARDLRTLGRSFRLERLALLDLFPQTGHMEAVAHLVRAD